MYQPMEPALLDREVSLPARDGETLFLKGDPCTHVLQIRQGIARTVAYSRDGDRQIIAFFFAGDAIGLPLAETHRYTAEAVSGLRFVRHPSHDFEVGRAGAGSTTGDTVDAVWKEEKAFIARSLILGRVGVHARTAAFLTYLSKHLETVDGEMRFSIPQSDIASYLATSPETVCRTLRAFRDQGIIAMRCRDSLQIKNHHRLSLIAAGN